MTEKLRIDEDACTGHGRCYSISPDLFVDDERGFGQVRGDGTVPDELVEIASQAVHSCPERAVTLETE